jgi:hypothetical protein
VVRRIQLPTSAELFDDPAPRPGRAAAQTRVAGPPIAEATADGRRRRPREPARLTPAALGKRMAQVEGTLNDLPIDVLIDLRDGLETLLAGDTVDEAELATLLALGRRGGG